MEKPLASNRLSISMEWRCLLSSFGRTNLLSNFTFISSLLGIVIDCDLINIKFFRIDAIVVALPSFVMLFPEEVSLSQSDEHSSQLIGKFFLLVDRDNLCNSILGLVPRTIGLGLIIAFCGLGLGQNFFGMKLMLRYKFSAQRSLGLLFGNVFNERLFAWRKNSSSSLLTPHDESIMF